MNSTRPSAQIKNSELNGFKILVLDPNQQRGIKNETQADLDQDLQQVLIFFTSTLHEARDRIRSRRPNLAIYPGEPDGQDFVSLQLEFRNANDNKP